MVLAAFIEDSLEAVLEGSRKRGNVVPAGDSCRVGKVSAIGNHFFAGDGAAIAIEGSGVRNRWEQYMWRFPRIPGFPDSPDSSSSSSAS